MFFVTHLSLEDSIKVYSYGLVSIKLNSVGKLLQTIQDID